MAAAASCSAAAQRLRAGAATLHAIRDTMSELLAGAQPLAIEQLAEFTAGLRHPQADPRPGILLMGGPPSTGKTTSAMCIAECLNSPDGRIPSDCPNFNDFYTRPFFCAIKCQNYNTQAVHKVAADIVAAIQKLYESEQRPAGEAKRRELDTEAPDLDELLRMDGAMAQEAEHLALTASPKRMVFFFDEFERLGGPLRDDMPDKNPYVYTSLMSFWNGGVVTFEGKEYRCPPGWEPVILIATNLCAADFTFDAGQECARNRSKYEALVLKLETFVKNRLLGARSGDTALATRIIGQTALFFAYSEEQCKRIISRFFQQLAAGHERERKYPVLFDLCTVEDAANQMAQGDVEKTVRELERQWITHVNSAFSHFDITIPNDMNSDTAICLSLRVDGHGRLVPRFQVAVDAKVRLRFLFGDERRARRGNIRERMWLMDPCACLCA